MTKQKFAEALTTIVTYLKEETDSEIYPDITVRRGRCYIGDATGGCISNFLKFIRDTYGAVRFSASHLYELYSAWSKENSYACTTITSFGTALNTLKVPKVRTSEGNFYIIK